MAEVIYIVCPLCGMNRVLEKTGASAITRGLTVKEVKGRIRFDHIDFERYIVQVRERSTGPEAKKRLRRGGGTGFVLKDGLTLAEMKDDMTYSDLIQQIRHSCQAILDILGKGEGQGI